LSLGLLLSLFVPSAHAGQLRVLYPFCSQANCSDGAVPHAGLMSDASGNLYGTTISGGAHGSGTVFKLAPDGTETVLYSFCAQPDCADGAAPYFGVVMDPSGNLYGTTACGGTGCGHGTVFRLAPGGTETVLHAFTGGSDGADPNGLIIDASGTLYGTTELGAGTGCGGAGCGTVFKVAPDGTETVLYSFCARRNCIDGASPFSGLILKAGKLYGTTTAGGKFGYGTVFRLSTNNKETVLYAFCPIDCADGASPYGGLIVDKSGNLYGTTTNGGGHGGGTVFRLAPDGSESVLYDFCSQANCADGANPFSALVRDRVGNLYGTTQSGGTGSGPDCAGCGTVFRLAPNGTQTVLHSFCSQQNCSDGGSFLAGMAGLLWDASTGKLYGATPQGGANGFSSGTLFAIKP
jgi:uncharacterized repeat protein (TIGR03803 family)